MKMEEETEHKGLGRKVLDFTKKHWYKPIPFIGSIIAEKRLKKPLPMGGLSPTSPPGTLYDAIVFSYIFTSLIYGSLNPVQWIKANNKEYEESLRKRELKKTTHSTNRFNLQHNFSRCKKYSTLEIANKYNIPYELTLKPSQKDKERIVKSLDNSLIE